MPKAKMVNLDRVLARIRALPPALTEALEDQLDTEARDLAAAVKRAAPVGETGKLRDSVRVEQGDHPLSQAVVVGDTPETRKKIRKGVRDADFEAARLTGGNKGEYDYPFGVEFGHRAPDGTHVPAQPFLFPTYRARKKAMRRRLKARARKVIRKHFPKG
ncbi:HK97 gp10 family phage protein [Phenylobacterium sp.]|uniref:HK97 gp10 family phage protein n=1 Tax=Phenylobacterium sp. TaxID=1871053 RepID=UPI00393F33A3